MAILRLEDICYGYEDGGYRREILKHLSYEFEEGKFYTILGPSGSGKTTLLSIIAGLDRPEQGKIYYENEDIEKIGLNKYRRNKVGIVFQSYNLINYLTGLENIELAMCETENKIPKNRKEIAYALLEKFGIVKSKADRLVTRLSGGEQQRVVIARAIVNNPKLLICDEPTGNLDPDTSMGIMKVLDDINKMGTTIVMTTHNRDIVNTMKKRVVVLNEGKIVQDYERGKYYEVL